jgi:glycosyltransferase involved in cell wall biosynthesis
MRTLLRDGRDCDHSAGFDCRKCPGSDQSVPKRLALAAGIVATRSVTRHGCPPTYIAVSRAVADRHVKAGIVDAIEVIPNFIDVPGRPITVAPASGPVLFVGPEAPSKGLPILRDAFKELRVGRKPVALHHVGGSRKIVEGAVIESGRLVGDALWDAFDDASMLIVPSTWAEPCPTVALEGMRAGRAVVASAVGGLVDIVEHGVTGLLVPPNNPQALAGAIAQLLDDPDRCQEMGRAGAERVVEFSTGVIGPRIEAVYRRLTAKMASHG